MSSADEVLSEDNVHVCKEGTVFIDEDWVYGAAVWGAVYRVKNGFVIGNGEYGSTVNFCPWCGEKAAP